MTISRVWAMPNRWTFKVPCISAFVNKYAGNGAGWADPFAGKSQLAEWRNDLNPELVQPTQCEALTFLEGIPATLHGAIFDPPYSLTQVSRSYRGLGLKFKGGENPSGGFPAVRDKIADLVRVGGYVLSFGWNTVGMGIGRGFEIVEILIVCHGGNRNDTLCTAETKIKEPLENLPLFGDP